MDNRPVIQLTLEEWAFGDRARSEFGPYVMIEPNRKKEQPGPNRDWPFENYQDVVDACPGVTFVQGVWPEAIRLRGAHEVTTGGFRNTAGLLSGASLFVGNHGGLVHAAAALGVPGVIVYGGDLAPHCFSYPENVNIVAEHSGGPCGKMKPCQLCISALSRIRPSTVAAALRAKLGIERERASA